MIHQPYLFAVPPAQIDLAWRDGAHHLSEAAEKSAGEVTTDQLKMLLARGERRLLGVRDLARPEDKPAAWAAVSALQLPNMRCLYIYAIWAPGATGDAVMAELRKFALSEGCLKIRGACGDSITRLWERRFAARRVYTIVEIDAEEQQ